MPRQPVQERQRARRSDSVRNSELVTEAAIEMFARHGKDVTLAQVAERAGVGKATVYRTYASREDMVAAMLEHRLAWVRSRMEQAAAGPDGWAEFAGLIRDVMERMRQDRLLLYVIVTPPTEMSDRMGSAVGPLILDVLAAARKAGRVRADITSSDLGILMSGTAAALAIKEDFESASWQRAADLILAACGTCPH
jgi:AcrR family transcriptional regulator